MLFQRWIIVAIVFFFSQNAFALTICISDCNHDQNSDGYILGSLAGDQPIPIGGGIDLLNDVFVDGDIYIDYSLFSDNEDLFITGDVSLTAETITIYQFNDTPVFPDSYNVYTVNSEPFIFNEFGSWVLFSTNPLSSGVYEASGNIYIGNYSSLAPVPLPASFLLLLSGLALVRFKLCSARSS